MLGLLKAILQENRITTDDGVALRDGLRQTNGFGQGDNLSPLCFSLLIKDLPAQITNTHSQVKLQCYADDVVLYSTSRFHLQQALCTLSAAANELGLKINKSTTEAMKFRRGGKLRADDEFRLEGEEVHF